MNRNFTLCFTFLLSLLCCTQRVEAQFLKKLFGGDNKPVKHKSTAKPVVKAPPPPVKKTHAEKLGYGASRFKERYRIDILVPLFLDDLVKNEKLTFKDHVPEKALTGVNFYQGIKLAADTLLRYGYHFDIYVHDLEDPTESSATLINTNALDSSDLIIGAVPTAQVSALAAYAGKHKINFISALSPSDGAVKNNPYFTLLQPTLQTHCEWLRKTIAKKYNRKNNIVVYRRSTVALDESSFKNITKDNAFTFAQINANALMKKEQLRNFFDSTATNVVVMPIVETAYAEQLLRQLSTSFPNYKFDVYGMPSWKGMNELRKTDSLPNIGIYVTEPFYFDPSTSGGQMIAASFHHQFGGKAGEMVFRGYETLYWYAYLLNKYGHTFNTKMGDNGAAMFTRFDIHPQWDNDDNLLYNENEHLYLYRFQGGNVMVEQ